jgi:hypothetical protein
MGRVVTPKSNLYGRVLPSFDLEHRYYRATVSRHDVPRQSFPGTPLWPPCGGLHDHTGGGNYTIASSGSQISSWWCSKFQMPCFDGYSFCAAGGAHTYVGSGNCILTFGGDDPGCAQVALVPGEWQTGRVFNDTAGQARIEIGVIDVSEKTVDLPIC